MAGSSGYECHIQIPFVVISGYTKKKKKKGRQKTAEFRLKRLRLWLWQHGNHNHRGKALINQLSFFADSGRVSYTVPPPLLRRASRMFCSLSVWRLHSIQAFWFRPITTTGLNEETSDLKVTKKLASERPSSMHICRGKGKGNIMICGNHNVLFYLTHIGHGKKKKWNETCSSTKIRFFVLR